MRARLRMARRLEDAGRYADARAAYETCRKGEEWLSKGEQRRIRVAIEDLDALLEEEAEAQLVD